MSVENPDNSLPPAEEEAGPPGGSAESGNSSQLPPRASNYGFGKEPQYGPPTPEVLANAPNSERDKASADSDEPDEQEQQERELRKGESALTWFANSLSKPANEDFTDMLRWARKTMIAAQVEEHQFEWLEKTRPLLDKLDEIAGLRDSLKMKLSCVLLVSADYLNQPKQRVYDLDYTASRQQWTRWLRDPEIRAVYDEMRRIMEDEILEHELQSIRHATRVTRIAAGRAAEVRMALLENPNPWVALQAARDIMQSADRETASKGGLHTNLNISAALSEEQVQQLLARASQELEGWSDIAGNQVYESDRPIVIIENNQEGKDIEDKLDLLSRDSLDSNRDTAD